MPPLPKEVQHSLLKLARRAIIDAVFHYRLPEKPASFRKSEQSSGVFVSLHRAGRLRGCIGNIESLEPLACSVASCAVSAALHDPRFPAVASEEVAQLEIEISVLGRPTLIGLSDVEVGRHGLIIRRGNVRSVLLPQVATDRAWTKEQFVGEICRKAGLPLDAWKQPQTQLFAFETQLFREADFEAHAKDV